MPPHKNNTFFLIPRETTRGGIFIPEREYIMRTMDEKLTKAVYKYAPKLHNLTSMLISADTELERLLAKRKFAPLREKLTIYIADIQWQGNFTMVGAVISAKNSPLIPMNIMFAAKRMPTDKEDVMLGVRMAIANGLNNLLITIGE